MNERNTQDNIIKVTLDYKDLEKGIQASKALMDAYERQLVAFQAKVQAAGGTVGATQYLGSRYVPNAAGTGKKPVAMFSQPFSIGKERGSLYTEMATSGKGKWSIAKQEIIEIKGATDKLAESTGILDARYGKLALRAAEVIPIWMALRTVYQGTIDAIANGIKFLIDFESAMAQIKIVGQGTEEEYKRLGDVIITFSTLYGVSATKALEAAKLFAQQGLKINEVIEMTRTAMIGAAVLGEDVSTVAENLTSAVRAYNVNISDSIQLIDKWMKVQKEYAVTAKDLAEATKTAGATAASFGISYDKFLGHITAIIEVTRKSGSQAGNALQMIYTRLFTTGAKAVQEIAKIPIYQDAAGNAVEETTHIFRNASDVIDDMALSWNKLSEAEKIELAAQVGSRRQVTPFIALMNNYNRALEAEVDALTSAGDALSSYNILQDTTQVKIIQMQNSWAQLAKTVGDTSAWKGIIDSIRGLAENLIFLANATDYAALKIQQQKQKEIDSISADKAKIEALNQLSSLQTRLEKNPTKNQELLQKVKTSREAILAANPALATMDIKAEEYKRVKDEVMRDRAKELALLEKASQYNWGTEAKWLLSGLGGPLTAGAKSQATAESTAYQAILKKYGNLANAKKQIDSSIEKETKARMAQAGVSGLMNEAEQNKYEARADVDLRKQKEIATEVEHRATVMKNLGASEEQTLRYLIQQYETNETLKRSEDARLKLTELRYKLEEEITSKIKEQSDILKSSTEGALKDWLLGKGDLKATITKITDTVREQTAGAISGGLVDRLFSATGIGNIFGIQMSNLRNILSGKGSLVSNIENAHATVYDWIVKGHRDGISLSSGGSAIASGNAALDNIIGGVGGYINYEKTPFGNGNVWSPYPTAGRNLNKISVGKGQGFVKAAGGWKNIGGSALLGYSMYQSARNGGKSQGISAASGLLSGLGMLGTMGAISSFSAGMAGYTAASMAAGGTAGALMPTIGAGLAAIGPVGWIGLAALAAGLALNMFGGSKKSAQTSVETKTTESRISSRIDVTNKNLEIINRNLLALKASVETYMLPSSAYFAEKRNIEDQFALFSRRGFMG